MSAIFLAWDADRGRNWDVNYSTAVAIVAETGFLRDRWQVGRHCSIGSGADAWLLLQGRQRGIIGHAAVISEPYRDPRHDGSSGDPRYVDVVFDVLLPRGEQLPIEVLGARLPGISWGRMHKSGSRVPAGEESGVRALWSEHVPPAEADPTAPVPGTLPEEALSRVLANRYERDPQARRECLARHGTSCAACGFSFEAVYGDHGRGFTHVHHIVPASRLGPDYELDPLTDLVPLCPNCHAMVHRGRATDPLTPAELRRIIAGSGYLEGSVVSHRELSAQRDAARILGSTST